MAKLSDNHSALRDRILQCARAGYGHFDDINDVDALVLLVSQIERHSREAVVAKNALHAKQLEVDDLRENLRSLNG